MLDHVLLGEASRVGLAECLEPIMINVKSGMCLLKEVTDYLDLVTG